MNIKIIKQYECDVSDVVESELKLIATAERFIGKLEEAGLPTEWFKERIVDYSGKSYDEVKGRVIGHVKKHADCAQVFESYESQSEFSYGANLGWEMWAIGVNTLKEKDDWFDRDAWSIGREVADVYFNSLGMSSEQTSTLKEMVYSTPGFEQAFNPKCERSDPTAYLKKAEEWDARKEQLGGE